MSEKKKPLPQDWVVFWILTPFVLAVAVELAKGDSDIVVWLKFFLLSSPVWFHFVRNIIGPCLGWKSSLARLERKKTHAMWWSDQRKKNIVHGQSASVPLQGGESGCHRINTDTGPLITVNPATGYPMINDASDTMGNPVGFNDSSHIGL